MGSYGEVWLARGVTGVYRAVKIIRRERFASEVPYEREFEGVRRFEEVSRGHRGLVDLYLVGRNDSGAFFYYVMALAADASGESEFNIHSYEPHTLGTDLKSGRLPVETCLTLGQSVAEALEELHTHGLVHRDVKPSNLIFLNGRYCLADIGMVTTANDEEAVVGTHGYLPQEGAGRPPADVFALGRVLYEAMTGADRQQFPVLPESMREGELPLAMAELNRVALKACAHAPGDRYHSAGDLAEDLAAIADGGRAVRAGEGWYWGWAAVVVGVLLLSWLLWPEAETPEAAHESLVIHWRFDGGLVDSSGAQNAAEVTWAQTTTDRHGNSGAALALLADGEVKAVRPLEWKPEEPRTVALWFRVDAWQETKRGWFEEHDSLRSATVLNGLGFAVQLKSNGYIGLDGNYLCALFRGEQMGTNEWHHLVVSSAGAISSARVWLDGTEVERAESTGRFWWQPDKPWRAVAADETGRVKVHFLAGAIDEVRVWRRALAPVEVKAIYGAEKPEHPTVGSEQWDAEYSWAHLNPANSARVKSRDRIRRVEETTPSGIVYWAPEVKCDQAEVVYQFDFDRSVARAHLRLPIYCVDLTPAREQPVRGAMAVAVSRDGEEWTVLYNGLQPDPLWGKGCGNGFFEGELPAPVLSGRRLFLRVQMRSEGGGATFSAVQLGRTPHGAEVGWEQAPVLRVKLQSP